VPKRGKVPLVLSPANRVFAVNSDVRGQAKKWLLKIDPVSGASVLESHYISEDAWSALVNNDHQRFVECRIETLIELEKSFMAEKGVRPPKEDRPAPSAIDVEDEVPLSGDEG
jgi:hypothetical protein